MTNTTQIRESHRDIKGHDKSVFSAMMVLVGGLPGTGKTYFSLRLCDKLDASYINSDLTRKQMDAHGRYAFEDKLNVYEEMAHRAAEELRRGKGVIVDATFYCSRMREIFSTLAQLMHFKLVFIEIVADENVVRKRLRGAEAGDDDLSVHNFVKTQYEQPDIDHLVIESKDGNIDGMLEEAMVYISKVTH